MRTFVTTATWAGLAVPVFAVWHWVYPESLQRQATGVLTVIGILVILRAAYATSRRARIFADRVLILGAGPLAIRLADELDARRNGPYRLLGFVDDATGGFSVVPGAQRLGAVETLSEIIAASRPTRIVLAMKDRRGRVLEGPLLDSRFRGVAVEEAASFFERLTGKLAIESLRPSALILSDGFRHSDFAGSGFGRAARRAASAGCAVAILIVASPVLALIAILIKLDSRGPVFFVQDRVGRGGKPFPLVKFRTMKIEEEAASEWAADNLDRITRVGHWLRRFRLDELPQFIHVVSGHMNLVGPRPHPVSNYQLFLENIPYYGLRSTVRPGVTGWAQVRIGYANGLEEETEKMRYDLYYIKQRSIWLDLRILFETAAVVVLSHRTRTVTPKPRTGTVGGQRKAGSPAKAG